MQQISNIENKLYLISLSILKNSEDAKDAMQESYIIAFRKYAQLRDKDCFMPWITKIIINQSYKIYKKRKRKVQFENEMRISAFSEKLDDTDFLFFEMICDLTEKDKKVIIYKYLNQLTLEEISREMRIPVSTVKTRLYKSLRLLKEKMEAE